MSSAKTPDVTFRRAEAGDVRRIVELLADDALGRHRESLEDPLPDSYHAAFEAIRSDPNNELIVAVAGGETVGVMQLTFTPSLTYRGSWRASIEGVRIASNLRGAGLGQAMIRWAIDRARERRCRIVQLTTDKSRPEALRFYEALGFQATHEGMKLHLSKIEPDESP